MPNLKLFCDPKPDYYYFQNEIIERAKACQNNWLSLIPVNRAVRMFSRKLIAYSPNKIVAAPAVFSFDNLLIDLYKESGQKTVISNELMGFLIEEILKKLAAKFTFLPNSESPPGRLILKVTKMISELRRFGYSANELSAKDADQLELDINKYDDFILILQQLEDHLGDAYIDHPHAMHEAALNLDEAAFRG